MIFGSSGMRENSKKITRQNEKRTRAPETFSGTAEPQRSRRFNRAVSDSDCWSRIDGTARADIGSDRRMPRRKSFPKLTRSRRGDVPVCRVLQKLLGLTQSRSDQCLFSLINGDFPRPVDCLGFQWVSEETPSELLRRSLRTPSERLPPLLFISS